MNETTGFCAGCFRTIDEIQQWWDMTPNQQQVLTEALEQRQAELLSFD